jgi:AbrB family looped-hinge helix DNA binding protein
MPVFSCSSFELSRNSAKFSKLRIVKRIAIMRINARGQVTIPARIGEQAGLLPNTEVEFVYDGDGEVRLFTAHGRNKVKSRGEALVECMRGKGDIKMTTEKIMALTRGT